MKQIFNICILIVFTSCWGKSAIHKEIKNKGVVSRDTAYVIVDSASINKQENTFDFILLYKQDGKANEIYRIKNRDYSIEFEYNFYHSDNKVDYICYTVNDLPTGQRWDILFNKRTKVFYKTDAYDRRAIGDELIKDTVDFEHETASVKSSELPIYKIKLMKIWGNK